MSGTITLGVVLAIALYLCWLMVQPFVKVILWAVVLAVVFYPLHRRIRARIGSPSGASIVSTLLVIVLILLPATFITIAVVRELVGAADNLQAGVQRLSTASTIPWVGWALDQARGYFNIDAAAAQKFLAERLQSWGGALAASTLLVVGGVVGAVVQIVLVVFTLFYLFRDGERIRQAVYNLLPLERMQMQDIAKRTQDVIARDHLRRAGDLRDPGHARHDHLLGPGAAVAAAVGRRDVLPVDDPDGGRVPRLGAGGALPRADRRVRQGGRAGGLGRPGDRLDRQLPVAEAGGAAGATARTADLLRRARRARTSSACWASCSVPCWWRSRSR